MSGEPKSDDHKRHKPDAMAANKAEMASEMGHGEGKDLEGMARDIRNRLRPSPENRAK
ncbi:MAG: hypothetical protein M0D55_07195 [Elusimicrobiota bacterium]|nr:MAG: hypothetical protein M0D55_07195 [Elusimicrobiota bacterium]